MLSTLSSGTIYGHNIKKEFKNFGVSSSNIVLLSVEKASFDDLVDVNAFI